MRTIEQTAKLTGTFVNAASIGDLETVKLCVEERGIDINVTFTEKQITAVFSACVMGKAQVVEYLLGHGADVNVKEKDGHFCLYMVARFGYVDIARLLLDHGADVNMMDNDKRTALTEACLLAQLDIVRLLLSRGAQVNIGWPCIVEACTGSDYLETPGLDVDAYWERKYQIVKELLAQGTFLNQKCPITGLNPLQYARHFKQPRIEALIMMTINGSKPSPSSSLSLSATSSNSSTSSKSQQQPPRREFSKAHIEDFTKACLLGDLQRVKTYLGLGMDPNVRDLGGFFPLFCASQDGHVQVARLLLDNEASVHMKMVDDGITALYIACLHGHTPVARLLIERGSDVNLSSNTSGFCLGAASQNGHLSVIELLLEQGANVNAMSAFKDETALGIACLNAQPEIVRFLMAHGADVNLGFPPILVACGSLTHEDKIANKSDYWDRKIVCVQELLKTNVNVHVVDSTTGFSPLQNAKHLKQNRICKLIRDYITATAAAQAKDSTTTSSANASATTNKTKKK